MDQISIVDAWYEYQKRTWVLFPPSACGTCTYWQVINEEALDLIEDTNKPQYKRIIAGIEGKPFESMKEKGEVVDGYSYRLFHGFCKRYPPACHVPLQIADYGFPLTSHTNSCGEWQKAPDDSDEDSD